MSRQRTIKHEVELVGRGLFSGWPVTARFKPAVAGAGVTFVRIDRDLPVRIPARIENVTAKPRRTSLRNGVAEVHTVEHCLAAIRGLGIDNIDVELTSSEVPSGDGSAEPFVERLLQAEVVEQPVERTEYRVTAPVRVTEGDAELVAWPNDAPRLDVVYELDYGKSPVGSQVFAFSLDRDDFRREIAPARTFVLEEEAKALQAGGQGTHLAYGDVLVIGRNGPIDNSYRFPDECVRHKVLDLIGDLMLMGSFVCGRIYARKSGHSLNHLLVRKLREQRGEQEFAARLVSSPKYDIRAVQRVLPHRFPMLMVDRVIQIEGDRRATGVKNVTINEPYFQGHYPRHPIMPGVLIIESMAQLGGILVSQKLEHTGKVAILLSLERVKFRRPVHPGDQLVLKAESVNVKSQSAQVRCEAYVGSELAAEASIRFMMVDADPN
ncbi:MAG: UDP-3-O-[3-hydroxymyristoyl] N-acetylglucosamine deacetylase [Phycisphaerales bacterium]|nr:UDP-3-O-[3-hydroxymyristoyl] N-acetylglucosamine deacetylase [Phycisphaerales bacterium]